MDANFEIASVSLHITHYIFFQDKIYIYEILSHYEKCYICLQTICLEQLWGIKK